MGVRGKSIHFNTNITKEELAYLAGIIDGEGCFFLGRFKQKKQTKDTVMAWHSLIRITNCEESLILWLEKHVGGQKDSRYRWTSKKKFCRPVYSWNANGKMLDFLLPLIKPYLVVKSKHCEVMAEFRKTNLAYTNKPLTEEILQKRFDLIKQMRNLNSRFHDHPLKELAPCHPSAGETP